MQLPLPLPDTVLTTEGAGPPPRARRIYCNRTLRLDQVEMVGFDMDYTLAIYDQVEMDRLSIEATVQKMVERGYPERLLAMPYRTDFPIRGLLIDRKLGNILKMDRYRYVKKAYHGLHELSRDERRLYYHRKRLRPGTRRYHWVDTLYALSEVSVFAAVVEELDRNGGPFDYQQVFSDVRTCIDAAHRDGSILNQVMADLPRYVHRDPDLADTLHKLRSAGKQLFVLTNSQPAYTDVMMRYLLDEGRPEYPSWRNYFDIIITASKKPTFFTGSAPFQELVGDDLPDAAEAVEAFERGRVYVGGNIAAFERMVGLSGDQILYVGDHIYGDVLRAKKDSSWRTAMIIQEMTDEMRALERCNGSIERMDQLGELREDLLVELRDAQSKLKDIQRRIDAIAPGKKRTALESEKLRYRRAVERQRTRLRATREELVVLEAAIDQVFHPFWGSLFKAGAEVSSFGDQIEVYACLYTDRVTNLLAYSPIHYFHSPRDRMPHER